MTTENYIDLINRFKVFNKIGFTIDGTFIFLGIFIGSEIIERILSNKGKNEIEYKYSEGTARVRLQDQYIHCDSGPACFSRKYGYRIWFKKGLIHRLYGPAIKLKEEWDDWCGKRAPIDKNTWVSNGISLMKKEIPLFYDDKIYNCVSITPEIVMKAMMIDREYGNFLKEKLRNESKRWNY